MSKKHTEKSSCKRSSTKHSTKSNPINSPSKSSSKNRKFKKRRETLHKINDVEENTAVDAEKEEQKKGNCHQCHIKKENVVHCNKCHIKKYCIPCITKWYPNFLKEEFTEACPGCRNICNCRACLRAFSPKDLQGYFCSEPDKLRYSKHMLQKIFLLVTYLDEEQLMEKEIDAKVKGLHRSELQLQEAECDVDDEISCDNCGTYIFDLYRCCTCGYELCLAFSRELRGGHLQGGKGLTCGWKAHKDGSIPCPPKDTGGCDDGILELKRIMPACWLSNMLEKAKKLYKINGCHAIPQTSIECCGCYDNRNETTFGKCNARRMISLSAKDIQPQDLQHFQLHWVKGEPIIVSDVLQTTSGLSWEPMVMWRAFRDITKTKNDSHANELKAINFLDWSEVTIDLYQFFRGYSEGLIIQKGCPLILKLEDWQPAWLSQGEWMRHFVEFVRYLPLKDYTVANSGYLNVATKLPDLSLKPELGPRMDIAYADSVTKLHYNKSDTAEDEVDQLKSCHQCQGNDNGGFVECNKCKSNIYCVPCITKWYPDIPKGDFVEACPVCRDNCNCKGCLNGFSPNPKANGNNGWLSDNDVNQVAVSLQDSEKKKSQEANGLWRGLNVGVEEKELLESIELHHPTTFQEVKFRSEQIWLPILKHLYKVIKGFLETTVDSLTEGQLTTHKENLEELERIGFNILWASERLDMIQRLKFGNEPLIRELTELEESLQAAKERVAEQQKAYLEAHEKLKEVQLEYNGISQAIQDKMQKMAGLYGADYDRVLKCHLGLGMLPEY